MSNEIENRDHSLGDHNYKELLEVIKKHVVAQTTFIVKASGIAFDIDLVAKKVADELGSNNKYPFTNLSGITHASSYFSSPDKKDEFSKQLIQNIVEPLQTHLTKYLKKDEKLKNLELHQYLAGLLTPLQEFANKKDAFEYKIDQTFNFQKQRLHLRSEKGKPWLKAHKLAIKVDQIQQIDQQLIEGICAYIKEQIQATPEELDEVTNALKSLAQKEESPFARVRSLLRNESVARIQREAEIRYLDSIAKSIHEHTRNNYTLPFFERYIERIKQFQVFLQQDLPAKFFEVTYGSERFDIRDLYARATDFHQLPFLGEVKGTLGESTDKVSGTKTFTSGLKLKLNGSVNIHGGNGQLVFNYNTALFDPNSLTYKQRQEASNSTKNFLAKTLRAAFLYYFCFYDLTNPQFQPALNIEQDLFLPLRTGNQDEKVAALKALKQRIDTPEMDSILKNMRKLQISFLETHDSFSQNMPADLVLSLKQGILAESADEMIDSHIFFKNDINTNGGMDAMKYITVEGAAVNKDSICKLPISLSMHYIDYSGEEGTQEDFNMQYLTDDIKVLPIFLSPLSPQGTPQGQRYEDRYSPLTKNHRRISLYYRHYPNMAPDSPAAFLYRFTYTLLSYTFLKILVDTVQPAFHNALFLPIICLHAKAKAKEPRREAKLDQDEFIHSLSKVLEHMFSQDCLSSSQGFNLNTLIETKDYKLKNALNSLYTALPQKYTFKKPGRPTPSNRPKLDKLAIFVISSRKCDANKKNPDFYQNTVFGEVITIERINGSESFKLQTRATFSVNQDQSTLYKKPEVLINYARQLARHGFHHLLYVAHAPYSSTLNISDKEELYFMNKEIIDQLRNIDVERMRVYPVFCDKYYVVNHQRPQGQRNAELDSLYIDDIAELSNVNNDPSKRTLVFFNIFNGTKVSNEHVYNGVVSYSTLLNVYDDVSYERYLWDDLLTDNLEHSIKPDLLNFLTLFHFARFEKGTDRGFKLDPYENIIGDDSVGKRGQFPHMISQIRFNSLAFLTLTRSILNTLRKGK